MSSSISSYSGQVTEMNKAKAEADVHERNAMLALATGKMNIEEAKKQGKAISGEEKALYAKAGVDISSGSPLLVLSETAAQTKLNVERAKWEAKAGYSTEHYYARLSDEAAQRMEQSIAVQGGVQLAATLAGGAMGAMGAGGMTGGGVGGALQGAYMGGTGNWGSMLAAMNAANKKNYGLGSSQTGYYSGYGYDSSWK